MSSETLQRIPSCDSNSSGYDLFQRAYDLELQMRHDEAENVYRRILQTEQDSLLQGRTLFRVAWLKMQARDYSRAATEFLAASQILAARTAPGTETTEAMFWAAFCLEVNGEILRALDVYSELEQTFSRKSDLCHRQIVCLDKLARFSEIPAYLDKFWNLVALDQDSPHRRGLYNEMAALQKQIDQLIRTYD